jgi:hypothetical protein
MLVEYQTQEYCNVPCNNGPPIIAMPMPANSLGGHGLSTLCLEIPTQSASFLGLLCQIGMDNGSLESLRRKKAGSHKLLLWQLPPSCTGRPLSYRPCRLLTARSANQSSRSKDHRGCSATQPPGSVDTVLKGSPASRLVFQAR